MQRPGHRTAFTLVELLIVVVILAILAATVIPQFTVSSEDAKDAVLRKNLQIFRKQIELFRAQHNGLNPGEGPNAGGLMLGHLGLYTNAAGDGSFVKSDEYPYGPYFASQQFPVNPFNGGWQVLNSSNPAGETPDHTVEHEGLVVGWFYDPATGRIAPNAEGVNSDGTPRIEY